MVRWLAETVECSSGARPRRNKNAPAMARTAKAVSAIHLKERRLAGAAVAVACDAEGCRACPVAAEVAAEAAGFCAEEEPLGLRELTPEGARVSSPTSATG